MPITTEQSTQPGTSRHAEVHGGIRPLVDPARATGNRLLAALPREILQQWLPHLEPVQMRLGSVVYEPGETLSHVYFPTTALVSLLHEGRVDGGNRDRRQ